MSMSLSTIKRSEIALKHLGLQLDAVYATESLMYQRSLLPADLYPLALHGLALTAMQ
jgi:hypothetical protein